MKTLYFFAAFICGSALLAQTQIGVNITPENPQHEEQFGFRSKISADGNTLATSAPIYESDMGAAVGRVVVYENTDNEWVQKGNDIVGSFIVSGFGIALDMTPDGNTIVGGAPLFPPAPPTPRRGQVRVFDYDGNDWVQRGQNIEGLNAGDRLGGTVSISADGNRIITGATQHDANGIDQTGETKVYQWNPDISMWELLGSALYGGEDDFMGIATEISQDGLRYASAAQYGNVDGSQNGYVKVYDFDGTDWVQVGNTLEGDADGDQFGFRLDFTEDASTLVVSARNANNMDGLVRVYKLNDDEDAWEQIGSTLNGSDSEEFGSAIDISFNGEILSIGGPQYSLGGDEFGRAKVFQFFEGDWIEIGNTITNPVAGINEQTGNSVSLDATGSRLSVGTGFFPSTANVNSGMVQVFDLADVIVLNVDNFATASEVVLYPNPVHESLRVYSGSNKQISEVAIYDVNGKLLLKNLNIESAINMSSFTAGFYLVSVMIEGEIFTFKILKD